MNGERRRYRAFISYSQKDKPYARRVHKALEAFRVPRGVNAPGLDAKTRKLGRFFRDDEEMGAASDLGSALRGAIADSEGLIVICSPNAAKSIWVDREIAHFKSTGRARKVFALIVAGEANVPTSNPKRRESECFPPALRFEIESDGSISNRPEEPLGIDIRKDSPARTHARLAAGLLGVPFDDLWRRAKRRALRQAMIAASLLAVIAIGGTAGFFWVNGTLTSTLRSASTAQVARIAERTEKAIAAAEALSDQRGAKRSEGAPEDTAAQADARWKAAALAYATALSGGEEQAKAFFPRLGYALATTYFPDQIVTAGDFVAGRSLRYVVSLDPPIVKTPDGKGLSRVGKMFSTADGTAADFDGRTLDSAAISASRKWMALASPDFDNEDDGGDPNQELTKEEVDALVSDASRIARVDIWDLETGKVAWPAKTRIPDYQQPKPVFSNKEDVLALARTGSLGLVDMTTRKPVTDYPYPTDRRIDPDDWVTWVAFSRDDSRVFVLLSSGWLLTLDLPTKTWLKPVRTLDGTDNNLSNSPIAKRINAGADKAHVVLARSFSTSAGDIMTSAYLLNVETGAVERKFEPECPRGSRFCTLDVLELWQDGKRALVTDDAGTRLVDLSGSGAPLALLPHDCPLILNGPSSGCATAAALSPSAPIVAIGGVGGEMRLVDGATGKDVRVFAAAGGSVRSLAFTPDGAKLVGLARTSFRQADGLIWVWDVESGRLESRSGLANALAGQIMAVEENGRRVLVREAHGATLWHALGPAGETVAEGLQRLCAVRGGAGLTLADDDRAALPASAPKEPDLCKWPG